MVLHWHDQWVQVGTAKLGQVVWPFLSVQKLKQASKIGNSDIWLSPTSLSSLWNSRYCWKFHRFWPRVKQGNFDASLPGEQHMHSLWGQHDTIPVGHLELGSSGLKSSARDHSPYIHHHLEWHRSEIVYFTQKNEHPAVIWWILLLHFFAPHHHPGVKNPSIIGTDLALFEANLEAVADTKESKYPDEHEKSLVTGCYNAPDMVL